MKKKLIVDMPMALECQVKQFVATVTIIKKGLVFNVYETGDPQYYLFRPVHNAWEGSLDFPMKKTRLKRRVARALRNGVSITLG